MGLAFIPLYIKYLGIEAYGLIGLFALLQAWLSLLDMGMTPTLGREMARFIGGSHSPQSIRDLLRSIELIFLGMAILIAGGIFLGAKWIAANWVQAESLPVEVVTQAFMVMGLVAALRFVEGIYRSSILGLQRQVLFNAVNIMFSTLRAFGVLAILEFVSPTIEAFFLWHGFLAIVTTCIFALITYKNIGDKLGYKQKFSLEALERVKWFSLGIFSISILSVLSTQVDKIMLSKLLSLSDYGYYTLAAIIASAITMLTTPITQAFYPVFCELYDKKDNIEMANAYHKSSQMVSLFSGVFGIIIIFFNEEILAIWTHDIELARKVGPILMPLMVAGLINALLWIPFHAQLAHGWTKLSLIGSLIGVSVLVPILYWVVPQYGALGAAWTSVALYIAYFLISIQFMHRKILKDEKMKWYTNDTLLPLGIQIMVAIISKALWSFDSEKPAMAIIAIIITAICMLAAGFFGADVVRKDSLSGAFKINNKLKF